MTEQRHEQTTTQAATATPQRTYLRIRRRRNAVSAQTIRFRCSAVDSNNDDKDNNTAVAALLTNTTTTASITSTQNATANTADAVFFDNKQQQQMLPPASKRPRTGSSSAAAVVWRRVSSTTLDGTGTAGAGANDDNEEDEELRAMLFHRDNKKKRTRHQYRVVDAVLEDDHDDNAAPSELEASPAGEQGSSSRKRQRRRLTLVQGAAAATSVPGGNLFDNTRSAFGSNGSKKNKRGRSVSNGGNKKSKGRPLAVLNPCERLVDDSLRQVFSGQTSVAEHFWLVTSDPRLVDRSRTWLTWCSETDGNLLHAAALWNDADTAREVLSRQLGGDVLYARDGEGRTPETVAAMVGHSDVQEVLALASQLEDYLDEEQDGGDNDEDYVFDLYCLEENPSNIGNQSAMEIGNENDDGDLDGDNHGSNNNDNSLLDCELDGGIGYWDDNGQLVLSRNVRTVSAADDIDDDDDSNDEGWGGNDYPDEEEGGDIDNGAEFCYDKHLYRAHSLDDDNDDDDSSSDGGGNGYNNINNNFRRRGLNYDDDGYDDEEGLFDAAYGSHQQESEYYDFEA